MSLYGFDRIHALGLRGPEKAPESIKKEFAEMELIGVNNDDISESESEVYHKAKKIFETEKNVVILGGDHSMTYPLFKAFSEKYAESFLIIFDAHADCMPPLKEPSHEEFLRAIIEKGHNPKRTVLIGARKIEPEEEKFLVEKKITLLDGKGTEEIVEWLKERTKNCPVYVSIDLDAIDPLQAPAVNYPEKGGMDKEKLLEIIRAISSETDVRAVDIVEYVPDKDEENKTFEIIKEIITTLNSSALS